jgi:hypothetical protein
MSKNINKKNEEKLKIYLAKVKTDDLTAGNKKDRNTGTKSPAN